MLRMYMEEVIMLKVLLVDDEPFILQGLKVLIDWEQEGFEIVRTASNGQEALEYLKENKVDLIIADINMPVMNGLDLLKNIKLTGVSDAYFVILSGYAEFSYAQKAIKFDCTEYIVKPVDREELTGTLAKVKSLRSISVQKSEKNKKMEQAYLARNIISLVRGKYDSMNLEYVRNHMRLSDTVAYVEVCLDGENIQDEISDEDKRKYQRRVFETCVEYLKENGDHCIFDVSNQEKVYDVGLIYCDYMGRENELSREEYLEQLLKYVKNVSEVPVNILVGKNVNDISNIARSYGTACRMRFFQGFREKKEIYYYEDEIQVDNSGILLCKKSIDGLIKAIEMNEQMDIRKEVENFYNEMSAMGSTTEVVNLNINYLLFQLIHLATEQDDGVNQEEILRIISESTFEDGIRRGSKTHLSRFASEYANYLTQLRKNVSRGVLFDIEKEIKENYMDNLTLKGLSEKYFVNSAYLGQLFRKKYGTSFKDYLNNYRMEAAAKMLLRTDDKIYQIAEAVGYKDLDYFVNRFIAAKGCTPARFRKQGGETA